MALAITTVTNSIAALSVTGLNIRDIDQIPFSVSERQCPILYPEPLNFVSDITVERVTTGTAGSGYFDVFYTLRYAYLYQKAGAGRGSLSNYQGVVQLWEDLIDRMIISDTLTGCEDIQVSGSVSFGPIPDPAGDMFIGSELLFRVHEFE